MRKEDTQKSQHEGWNSKRKEEKNEMKWSTQEERQKKRSGKEIQTRRRKGGGVQEKEKANGEYKGRAMKVNRRKEKEKR